MRQVSLSISSDYIVTLAAIFPIMRIVKIRSPELHSHLSQSPIRPPIPGLEDDAGDHHVEASGVRV